MQESKYFQITLRLPLPHAIVLQGLDRWFSLGLISNLSWRSFPQEQPDREIILTIYKDKNIELFAGITDWLELGLLNDKQVRNICKNHLSSQLPDYISVKSRVGTNKQTTLPELDLNQIPVASPLPKLRSPAQSSAPTQMLQALFSEFSTLWLLFLGVFLTVVSSGLLAASQWQNFSSVGQYLILFAYTLGFLGVSFITTKSDRLRLTTRTLQLVTLLLVPANFWAIDGLGLLDSAMGIGLGAIAGLVLSGITIFLLQTSSISSSSDRQNNPRLDPLTAIAILLLAWTHLGWGFTGYPLVAVYIGIGGIATATFFNRYHKIKQKSNRSDISPFPLTRIIGICGTMLLVARALLFGNVSVFALGLAIGICGWVLCQMDRQVSHLQNGEFADAQLKTSNENSFNQNLDENSSVFEARLGRVLLALGWFTAVWDSFPWQAIAVSLLIAWLIGDRLHENKSPNDLTKLFFWGLQILWLFVRLIPDAWWEGTEGWARITAFFQTDASSAIIGVVSFPYLLLAIGFAIIYRRDRQYALALRSEHLALGFGAFLSVLSFAYPFTRLINLSLSALILGFVLVRRSPSSNLQFLIYTTHLVSLGAIASGVNYSFPRLTSGSWAVICLMIALAEWGVTWGLDLASARASHQDLHQDLSVQLANKQIWRNSCWQLGLCLSGLSYFLAIATLPTLSLLPISEISTNESYDHLIGLIWAIAPLTLGFLGTQKSFKAQAKATEFSIVGLYIGQLLTWDDGTRLIGLGLAVLMMLVNTRRLINLFTTLTTTGFSLLFIGFSLWQIKENTGAIAQLSISINGIVFSVILLFMLSHWLKYRYDSVRDSSLRQVVNPNLSLNNAYSQAFDLWAVFLSTFILLLQTYLAFSVFSNFSAIAFWNGDSSRELFANLFLSSVLITLGLVYRVWQKPVFWTEWGIAWGIELIVAGAIALNNSGYNGSVIQLAIANLGLGLITQLLGDWWHTGQITGQITGQSTGQNRYPLSWNLIPLIYVAIGTLLRLGTFSDSTGFFTLSAALVGIGIGRRSDRPIKFLTYISLLGITFGAYELLFYQMIAANRGDNLGDGMVILGVLGGAIAYTYQVCSRWIMPYLKLSSQEINTFAHLHWLISASLLLVGSLFSPSPMGGAIGVGLAIALMIYALTQGRKSDATAEGWVYVGIAMGILGTVYQFGYASPNFWLNQNILIPYSAAIASGVATIFFLIPWRAWGWSPRPWFRSAMVLPLLFIVFYTISDVKAIATPSLLILAIFYAVRALVNRQIRLTYLSVWFLAWISFRFIADYTYVQSFTSACIICSSIIYFSHVEPSLKYDANDSGQNPNRDINHILRSLAIGSLCLIAFVYALSDVQMALITWGLSMAFAIAGLILRVRAYLFIGTITFILLVLNQAVLLVSQYGFLLWAIGIVAGISFITIAANFEVRRDRILAIARHILNELDAWA